MSQKSGFIVQRERFLIKCHLSQYPSRVIVEHTTRAVCNHFGRFLRDRVEGFRYVAIL